MGPRREFGIFAGVQDTHRDTTRRTTFSSRTGSSSNTGAEAPLGSPVAEPLVHGDARRRLAHRLRQLVHPAQAARQNFALT